MLRPVANWSAHAFSKESNYTRAAMSVWKGEPDTARYVRLFHTKWERIFFDENFISLRLAMKFVKILMPQTT